MGYGKLQRFEWKRELSNCYLKAIIMSTSIRSKLEESNEGTLNKLIKALDMLSVLEKRHQDLLKEYESLAEKYLYTKKCSIDAVWGYIPTKSRSIHSFKIYNFTMFCYIIS